MHNNAQAHQALATRKKLAYLGFQCLDQAPYSPDLAPSDYHLFPGLKKQLKGHLFPSEAEVIAASRTMKNLSSVSINLPLLVICMVLIIIIGPIEDIYGYRYTN